MSRLARPAPLPLADKARISAEVLLTYPRVRWMLRRLEIREALRRLRPRAPDPAPPGAARLASGIRLGRAVHRTLGPLPTDTRCLTQALVLTRLLARRGLEGTLVIAVRPGDEFGAHAWVELGGHPVLPPGEPGYERLVEL